MASLIRSNLYRDDQRKQEIPEYIQLFDLVSRGDIDGTKEFLGASFDQKALMKQVDSRGRSLLHVAVMQNK